jgi:hypothetical protein
LTTEFNLSSIDLEADEYAPGHQWEREEHQGTPSGTERDDDRTDASEATLIAVDHERGDCHEEESFGNRNRRVVEEGDIFGRLDLADDDGSPDGNVGDGGQCDDTESYLTFAF